jgi:hypothetical protein
VVGNFAPLLAQGRFLVLVIGDKYARGEWVPLGFQTMEVVQAARLSAQKHLRQGHPRESRQARAVSPVALPRPQAQLLCVQARVCDVFREN